MVPAHPPDVGRVANRFSSAWALPRAPVRVAKRYICRSSAFIALMAMHLRQLAIRQTLHRCSGRVSRFPARRRLSIWLRRRPPNAMYVPFLAFHILIHETLHTQWFLILFRCLIRLSGLKHAWAEGLVIVPSCNWFPGPTKRNKRLLKRLLGPLRTPNMRGRKAW